MSKTIEISLELAAIFADDHAPYQHLMAAKKRLRALLAVPAEQIDEAGDWFAVAQPVPPADGEVEVLATTCHDHTVKWVSASWRKIPLNTELVDRAHVTRLQAELADEKKGYDEEIDKIQSELDALKAQPQGEPVAWFVVSPGELEPVRGVAHSEEFAEKYRSAGWTVTPLYASPPAPVAVVLPERADYRIGSHDRQNGWNACLDELKRLNPWL